MVTVCCVCHKLKKNKNSWVKRAVKENVLLSHGYCPSCYGEIMDILQLKQRIKK